MEKLHGEIIEKRVTISTMQRTIRVVTQGKELDVISHEIAAAIQGGSRVLVKAARVSDALPSKLDGDKGAVADWARTLSQKHRLVWKRVGLDVLFARPD